MSRFNSLSAIIQHTCCGTTCERGAIVAAVRALEEANAELVRLAEPAFSPLYRQGDRVQESSHRGSTVPEHRGTVLFSGYRVALLMDDGSILITNQSLLSPISLSNT